MTNPLNTRRSGVRENNNEEMSVKLSQPVVFGSEQRVAESALAIPGRRPGPCPVVTISGGPDAEKPEPLSAVVSGWSFQTGGGLRGEAGAERLFDADVYPEPAGRPDEGVSGVKTTGATMAGERCDRAVASVKFPETSAALYGLTNIRLTKLTMTPEQWPQVQPRRVPPLPNMNNGGKLALRNPKASRSGLAGVLGIDFHWAEATFEFAGKKFERVAVRYRGRCQQ